MNNLLMDQVQELTEHGVGSGILQVVVRCISGRSLMGIRPFAVNGGALGVASQPSEARVGAAHHRIDGHIRSQLQPPYCDGLSVSTTRVYHESREK